MSDNPTPDSISSRFSTQSLERIRKRLLDLTARNRLLNFRHTAAQTVRIIDELPDPIYQRLLDGKSFEMAAVPDPTEKQLIEDGYITFDEITGEKIEDSFPKPERWAKRLGFNTDYELPVGCAENPNSAHNDDELQTLLFNATLDSRLQKVRRLADTAMDESGANILFLSLGFLEWRERRDSEVMRQAPLFVVPVNLARGKRTGTGRVRKYTVTLRDDDLLSNISLSERLAADFGIELPPLDEDTIPEAYFDSVLNIVKQVDSGWKIRRFATLCLLDFTKQVMYQDLDPDNWPAGSSIVDHPLVTQFFSDADSESGGLANSYLQEHEIDSLPQVHQNYPLIFEADSSQHSAVVDVVEGNNLVIEGPPGTGKSQTITNLIAACINQGKRVLFVAEKLAALEVVKRRLDIAGLGDYCLELHSHKSNKVQLLQSLVASVDARNRNRAPAELQSEINRYEAHKETLHIYANKLNSPWKDTGLTPHQILQRAVDYRERCPIDPDSAAIEVASAGDINAELITKQLDTAERLRLVFDAVAEQAEGGNIENHHWYGIDRSELVGADRQSLLTSLREWTVSLEGIAGQWQVLSNLLGIVNSDTPTTDELATTVANLQQLPNDIPASVLQRSNDLQTNIDKLKELSDNHFEFRERMAEFVELIKPHFLLDENAADEVDNAIITLRETLGLTGTASPGRIIAHPSSIDTLIERTKDLSSNLAPLQAALPSQFESLFADSVSGFRELKQFLDLAELLPTELWAYRDPVLQQPAAIRNIEVLAENIIKLRSDRASLEATVDLQAAPNSQTLKHLRRTVNSAGMFGFFKGDVRAAKRELKLLAVSKIKYDSLDKQLSILTRHLEELEELDAQHVRNPVLGHLYKGLDTPIERLSTIASWCDKVQAHYGFGNNTSADCGHALLNLDQQQVNILLRTLQVDVSTDTNRLLSSIDKIYQLYPTHFSGLDESLNWIESDHGLIDLKNSIAECLECFHLHLDDDSLELSELANIVTRWRGCVQEHSSWIAEETHQQFVPSLFEVSANPTIDDSLEVQKLKTAIDYAQVLSTAPVLATAMQLEPTNTQLARIIDATPNMGSQLKSMEVQREQFLNIGNVDLDMWLDTSTNTELAINRNKKALAEPAWLETWLSYQRVKTRLTKDGLANFIEALEQQQFNSNDTNVVVSASLYEQLARHVLATDSVIADFDGNDQLAVQTQFSQFDKRLLELQREQIAWQCGQNDVPAGNAQGRVATHTEFALIQREAAKKTRHIAIRSLLGRSSKAIGALKPCFMMSPMSVAQYLAPGEYSFDLIVMDEASQIRPEEALGAIARADQLVVVGDPKQLPPTTFFSRMAGDNEDDTDDVGLEQAESILDTVMPLFPTRRLRWHYRSRHESLIAFSNQKFYDSNLILFPSPFGQTEEFGVKYERVEDGRFFENTNLAESTRIVDFISDQLVNRPDESVGVVTMNIKQRDQVEAQLEIAMNTDPILARAYETNAIKDEPLFIKNLENVQGDERDVIVISMTYGPAEVGGITYQRFGPINSDVGWRRLNVLLTRSKKRMEIFSSMGSGDVRVSNTSSRGVKALRALLEYCESGHLQTTEHTGRPPDSSFEIAVMRRLADAGYEAEPQLGVAGFFIDLAVRDPGKPGRFLLAIECDGASYHSAKSARDRDRLRQEVLENLGWKVRRIWSTDWFRNPEAQMMPILADLEAMRTNPSFEDLIEL